MLPKKFFLLFVFTAIVWQPGRGQATIHIDTNNLKAKAMRMVESLLQADYQTFIKYNHPKVVQLSGGEEKMIEVLKNELQKLKDQGITFKSISIGLTPQIVKAGDEIHTLVSQQLIMTVPGGTVTADSYLLAISADGGTNWTFVDTTPLGNEETLKSMFPKYNMELKIPPKPKPTFVKTE